MQKNLVIVESPAKAKTIEKFLGEDFKVMSSFGHIRDLQKKDLGIDMANDFSPVYEISEDKKKLVTELKKEAKKADIVWLASDEDREGEAISWHLYETLNLKPENTKRIAFHEITKNAVLSAIENPRDIDLNLVDAQQARRIIDRIVGFNLSPILWRKIKPQLSAGRVQSVAVRLIVEKEREINNFKVEDFYRVIAYFEKNEKKFKAELTNKLKTKEEATNLLEKWKSAIFTVENVEQKPTKRTPAAPFTTSTLQQEASRKLGYSVSQTMSIAQKLYESGKITYMRTDSVNLSELAINAAKEEIIKMYDKSYVKIRKYATKSKGAQEAHEAIRPTVIANHSAGSTAQEKKLYDLIWKRTIASQMSDAILEKTIISINANNDDHKIQAHGEVVTFPGFLNVYMESNDDESDRDEQNLLPKVEVNEILPLVEATATQRFTQRPSRYSEASLVKKLEDLGIGRPSTYAPTISTIQNREYVIKSNLEGQERAFNQQTLRNGQIADEDKIERTGADKNKLMPTDTGIVVNDYLADHFPEIMKYEFTALIEKEFDRIASGSYEWKTLIKKFYEVFHPAVDTAMNSKDDRRVGEIILGNHPKTGRQVSVRIGKYGPMVQIGVQEDEEKPEFAGLPKELTMQNLSLEQALKLFELPRNLGEYEQKVVTVAIGRFGPYIRHNNKFVSLPKVHDPYSVDYDTAIELIEAKRKADSEKVIHDFGDELFVLNGRYGPYIEYKENNYKLPKGIEAKMLTKEDCLKIVEDNPNPKPKRGKAKATIKTTVKKEKTAKAKSAKSTEKSTVKAKKDTVKSKKIEE